MEVTVDLLAPFDVDTFARGGVVLAKTEEDELFQKDEEKRVIVFNTNQLKEWTEASKNSTPTFSDVPPPAIPAGAMQVELPMRIAGYCRDQNEKLGFQYVLTPPVLNM